MSESAGVRTKVDLLSSVTAVQAVDRALVDVGHDPRGLTQPVLAVARQVDGLRHWAAGYLTKGTYQRATRDALHADGMSDADITAVIAANTGPHEVASGKNWEPPRYGQAAPSMPELRTQEADALEDVLDEVLRRLAVVVPLTQQADSVGLTQESASALPSGPTREDALKAAAVVAEGVTLVGEAVGVLEGAFTNFRLRVEQIVEERVREREAASRAAASAEYLEVVSDVAARGEGMLSSIRRAERDASGRTV